MKSAKERSWTNKLAVIENGHLQAVWCARAADPQKTFPPCRNITKMKVIRK